MSDSFNWNVEWEVHKYKTDTADDVRQNKIEPYEVLNKKGNLLMYKGASSMWEYMLGNGTTSAGSALAYFNNSNSRIVVGTSTISVSGLQTNLQSGTATYSRAIGTMEATYPQHLNVNDAAAGTVTFKSIYGPGVAEFDWNEWGIFNGTAATSTMLNRKQEYLGIKQGGETWTLLVNIRLS